MSLKLKALLYTIPTVFVSLIIVLTINFLVTVIGSSLLATVLSLVVWGFIVYKFTLGYLKFQKEL
jgi:hypothetical protein